MSNRERFGALPLRERKLARTKLRLLGAALNALKERPLESIPVRELCDAVPISEASFFNYFPRKTDLLTYYVQLWSLEMGWHAGRLAADAGGLAAIEAVFALTGRQVRERPGVMSEIIAEQVRMTERPAFEEVTVAERLLAFPDLEGIEEVTGVGLEELLPPLVDRAIAGGQLPGSTDAAAVLAALGAIFFGVPVYHRRLDPDRVAAAYGTQLELLWTGLRAGPGPERP